MKYVFEKYLINDKLNLIHDNFYEDGYETFEEFLKEFQNRIKKIEIYCKKKNIIINIITYYKIYFIFF
jgi:hypothetical protein